MNTEEEDRRKTRDRVGVLSVQRKEGRLELRQNCWSVRVANKWDMVKSAATVNSRKNGSDNWTEREKKRGEMQPTLWAPEKNSSTKLSIGSSYKCLWCDLHDIAATYHYLKNKYSL